MAYELISGSQAAAIGAQRAGVDLVAAYPITPQTAIVESLASFDARGELDGEFVSMESEYSALATCNGASAAGARTFVATSSHGLAYMHEMIHWCAGARFPIVMVNVNRAIGAPWCLDPDQGDSLSQRDTGWLQIYCSGAQQVVDTVIQAYVLAESLLLPCMVVFDGFYISHTYEAVDVPDLALAREFVGPPKFAPQMVPGNIANLHGMTSGVDQHKLIRGRHEAMKSALSVFEKINSRYGEVFGRSYSPLEVEIPPGAKKAVFTAGAVAETVLWALPRFPGLGVIALRLFRPFPSEKICELVEEYGLEEIYVIDRNCSTGSGGIFAQELKSALYMIDNPPKVRSIILAGGIDFTPGMLEKALESEIAPGMIDQVWGGELS